MNLHDYPWPDPFTAGRCQARIKHVCMGRADHLHHRRRPRSRLENNTPENLLPCCFFCHSALHSHANWAYDVGLLIHEFEDIVPWWDLDPRAIEDGWKVKA